MVIGLVVGAGALYVVGPTRSVTTTQTTIQPTTTYSTLTNILYSTVTQVSTVTSVTISVPQNLYSFESTFQAISSLTKVTENNSNSFNAYPNAETDVGFFNAGYNGYVLVNVTNLSQSGVAGVEFECNCLSGYSGSESGITNNYPIYGISGVVLIPVSSGDVFVFISNSEGSIVNGEVSIVYYHA